MNIFKEKQIKIKINTNINNKNKEDELIILTSSMIKIIKSSIKSSIVLEEYPYFTDVVEYPWNYLQQLPYIKMVEIFFDHTTFVRMLIDYNPEYYRTESIKMEKMQRINCS
jgi:hypothetical protein